MFVFWSPITSSKAVQYIAIHPVKEVRCNSNNSSSNKTEKKGIQRKRKKRGKKRDEGGRGWKLHIIRRVEHLKPVVGDRSCRELSNVTCDCSVLAGYFCCCSSSLSLLVLFLYRCSNEANRISNCNNWRPGGFDGNVIKVGDITENARPQISIQRNWMTQATAATTTITMFFFKREGTSKMVER